jgi:hypothetical protein
MTARYQVTIYGRTAIHGALIDITHGFASKARAEAFARAIARYLPTERYTVSGRSAGQVPRDPVGVPRRGQVLEITRQGTVRPAKYLIPTPPPPPPRGWA